MMEEREIGVEGQLGKGPYGETDEPRRVNGGEASRLLYAELYDRTNRRENVESDGIDDYQGWNIFLAREEAGFYYKMKGKGEAKDETGRAKKKTAMGLFFFFKERKRKSSRKGHEKMKKQDPERTTTSTDTKHVHFMRLFPSLV